MSDRMVRLTMDLMVRGTSGYAKKKKEETTDQFAKRLTHLYLEGKNISEVGEDLSLCRNLVVLYLYDNQLTEVPSLNFNCNLTHLYLQNNHITKITNLWALSKLIKLYLGGNQITVIEGLDKLEQLQELHVEHQHLPAGEKLLFDPRSLQSLSKNLEVLNVSGNFLESLTDLEILKNLTQLHASDNQLNDMRELAQLVAQWPKLTRLELAGNPLCHKPKYKDRIIVMCKQLATLDGKEITDTARQFLRSWHANRESNKKKHEEFVRQQSFITEPKVTKADGDRFGRELPPVSAHPRTASGIPGYLMPGLPRKEFDDLLLRSNAGDSRGSAKPLSGFVHSNAPHGYAVQKKPTVSSAPARRRPLMSVHIDHFASLDQSGRLAPF